MGRRILNADVRAVKADTHMYNARIRTNTVLTAMWGTCGGKAGHRGYSGSVVRAPVRRRRALTSFAEREKPREGEGENVGE
ncbi:hypothetical protein NL676_023662 [Syzygium grande]|nr:hypothetical protein NL676_023662 [Syzygium grande]